MECKICKGKIIIRCRCIRGDSTCENGHSYHWSPFYSEYHEGISDHNTDSCSADCCVEKIKVAVF